MVWLIVIIAELNVFILLQGCTCYPYVPSTDLNYNQGVETRRIIEQSSSENNAFMHIVLFFFSFFRKISASVRASAEREKEN